jgi:cytosine/adenosine deaminase-related metal-dependent hydrolase
MIVQLCSMPIPAELVEAVLRPVMAAMLRSGITGVVDAGSAGLDGLVSAAIDTGLRAAIGPSLADCWHDPTGRIERQADTDALLTGADEWAQANDGAGAGRIRTVVSAIEPIAASDELLTGIARIAGHHSPVHVHSHISEPSMADHDTYHHRSQTDRLGDAGLLHDRCTLMHAGAATDSDIAAFAHARVTVNANPLGNAMLGFGVARHRTIERLRTAGVPVVLGSDYAPSMIATPFDMIRATLITQREVSANDAALTIEQALAMAWNGAVPLGQPGRLGRLAAGQLADVVVIDTSGAHHLGNTHPAASLALRAQAGDVRTVIVNGSVVVDDGVLVTLDEEQAITTAISALDAVARHDA